MPGKKSSEITLFLSEQKVMGMIIMITAPFGWLPAGAGLPAYRQAGAVAPQGKILRLAQGKTNLSICQMKMPRAASIKTNMQTRKMALKSCVESPGLASFLILGLS